MKFEDAPDHIKAADAHNIAQDGESIFDYSSLADNLTQEEVEDSGVLSYTRNLLGASLVSGGVGIVNTVRDIANLTLPAAREYEMLDTFDTIAAADSNMAEFYKDHKIGSDVLGFIASSAIPTTWGLKLFRGFQTTLRGAESGLVGTNMSRATKLLVPNAELQIKIHGAELASRNATWKLFDARTLKTIGSKAHQGFLEGIVAESVVLATNYRSPLFDDFEVSDYIENFGIGVALGVPLGAIGGLGSSYFQTKKLVKHANARELELASNATVLRSMSKKGSEVFKLSKDEEFLSTDFADQVLAAADDISRNAEPITYDQVLSKKLAQKESGYSVSPEAVQEEVKFLNRQRELNLEKLKNSARKAIRDLETSPNASKDETFGNLLADIYAGTKVEKSGIFSAFTRMKGYTRLGEKSEFDKLVSQTAKSEKISLDEARQLLGSDPTKYITIHSGLIGETVGDAPKLIRMADFVTPDTIKSAIKSARKGLGKTQSNFWSQDFRKLGILNKIELRWAAVRGLDDTALEKLGTVKNPVHESDLPLIRELSKRQKGREFHVIKVSNTGVEYRDIVRTADDLAQLYESSQRKALISLINKKASAEEIELITDIRADVVSGKVSGDNVPDIGNAQEFNARRLSEATGNTISAADLYTLPKYAKVSYAEDLIEGESSELITAMQGIAYRQKLYQEVADRAVASYLGEDSELFVPLTNSLLGKAWRGGTGQGGFFGAGGDYGSLEAAISQNGNIVSKLEQKVISGIKQDLEEATQILISNPAIAVRFSAINELLAGLPERYTFSKDGVGLIPTKLAEWEAAQGTKTFPKLAEDIPQLIEIESPELQKVIQAHMQRDFIKNGHRRNIAAPFGNTHETKFEFYPVRQDPRQFKHVAFVVDETLTGVGHKRMLLGRNAKELEEQIKLVPEQFRVVTKTQAEEYHKAIGDWSYDATLHDNYLDHELASKGIRSNFFPMTDPRLIADTFLQHHIRNETALFRESVKTKFYPAIETLERRGRLYANIAESSTDHISRLQESSRSNPYMSMIKSLLNTTQLENVPGYWLSAQKALDQVVSKAWNRVTDVVRNSKLTSPAAIARVQKAFAEVTEYHPEFGGFNTTGQALEFIISRSGKRFETELAKLMLPHIKDVPFHVAESGVSIPGKLAVNEMEGANAIFVPRPDFVGRIIVKGSSFGTRSAGINNVTVLHEALHSFIHNKLLSGKFASHLDAGVTNFANKHEAIWERFKSAYIKTLTKNPEKIPAFMGGWLTEMTNNFYEFATYGLTEPRIRKFLNELPSADGAASIGAEFVENVSSILGLKKPSVLSNLLDSIGESGDVVANKDVKDWFAGLQFAERTVDSIIAESDKAFGTLGFRSAYWGAAEQIFANTRVDQGVLTTFIRTANAFLVNSVLRWDAINSVVNKISLPIIMLPEIKSLIAGIKTGNPEVAGELARLSEVTVPGTGGDTILSPHKLIKNAYSMLHSEGAGKIISELKRRGIVVDTMDQYYKGIDALTITGAERAHDLTSKTEQLRQAIGDWSNKVAVYTGNEYVERTNRAVAALTMKQITDLAVRSGIISEKESWAYINLFVNRTNGVIRAAERPLMFQGPIGQAMGLFQSYQLNLMQQAFRHIGTGNAKYAAMMAGLQTSIFGAASLPGFDIINNKLIGEAAGNPEHQDAFSASKSALGDAADWLMYGAPSNFTNTALFTRGDTNPRSWTVVPNPLNPSELPAVSSFAKAMQSVKTAVNASADGAPIWNSFLLGLEHLGISRPLSGLAVSLRALGDDELRATSTQRNAQFLYANDLLSLTTLARIAGAKPLDEAKMVDNFYRINAYASQDRKRRENLGIAMKVSLLGEASPSGELYGDYAAEYAARGGNQSRFNAYWMSQYKSANISQAKQLADRLGSPYARNMQFLLGGTEGLSAIE